MEIFKICDENRDKHVIINSLLDTKCSCLECEKNNADFVIIMGHRHSNVSVLCKDCAYNLFELLDDTHYTNFIETSLSKLLKKSA